VLSNRSFSAGALPPTGFVHSGSRCICPTRLGTYANTSRNNTPRLCDAGRDVDKLRQTLLEAPGILSHAVVAGRPSPN